MKHLIICILCSVTIQAQHYEGTIGEYQIFFSLDTDYGDNRATAFYFYKSQLKNIPLEGSHDASQLTLYEKYSEKEEEKELFNLTIDNDKISGTWQNNGRKQQVNLIKTTKSFEDYKVLKLKLVRDSISTYNDKELVWFSEKHSKKSLFRLGNGFTKSERQLINPKLDSIHTDYAVIGLECSWADIHIKIELVSNHYISFTEYSSIFCGGAHPNYNIAGYNFDLQNKVHLDKITRIYPNINPYQLLKKKYENDTDLDKECEYFLDNGELWDYYTWVFTPKGITITPSFPHAMTPCEIGFPLTYEELQQK